MAWKEDLESRYMPGLSQMHPASLGLILVLIWLMVAGLLAGSWIMPAWRAWKALDGERSMLEGQTALPASALGDHSLVRRETLVLEQQLANVPRGLTRGAIAMEQIRQSARNAGVLQAQVRMSGENSKDGLMHFDVDLQGSYGALGTWLENLPQELPWMAVRRVHFNRSGGVDKAQAGALGLTAQLTLVIEGEQEDKP